MKRNLTPFTLLGLDANSSKTGGQQNIGPEGLLGKWKLKEFEGTTGKLGKAPNLGQRGAGRASRAYGISAKNRTAHRLAALGKGFRRGRVWGQRPGRTISTAGARPRSVVKSRFVNGGSKRRLKAHVNYLQNRERAPFEKERKFFTKDRNGLDHSQVLEEAYKARGHSVDYHKIILSSGDNSIHLEDHAREVMKEWEEALGRKLNWWGIAHRNTDHYHVHLLVAGKSLDKREVWLDRESLSLMREISNDYLDKQREIDRSLDLEVQYKLGQLERDFDISEKLLEFGRTPFSEWVEQVQLGLSTNADYQREWRELGLGKVYDLGRPFEDLKQVDRPASDIDHEEASKTEQEKALSSAEKTSERTVEESERLEDTQADRSLGDDEGRVSEDRESRDQMDEENQKMNGGPQPGGLMQQAKTETPGSDQATATPQVQGGEEKDKQEPDRDSREDDDRLNRRR